MTTLRQSILSETRPRNLKSDLGILFLCLFLSAWVHLLAFTIWQKVDDRAADRFVFVLEEPPVLELTLFMDEIGEEVPPAAEETDLASVDPQELYEPEEIPPPAAEPDYPLTAADDPRPIDEELAKTELLPPEEPDGPANPDPPMTAEAEAPKFRSYYTIIRSAVGRRWILPPEVNRTGRLTVDATISRDGALLRLVVIESSGSATLDHAGLEALRAAAPFPPFTEELAQYSQLDIRMNFDYKARRRGP